MGLDTSEETLWRQRVLEMCSQGLCPPESLAEPVCTAESEPPGSWRTTGGHGGQNHPCVCQQDAGPLPCRAETWKGQI